VATETEIQRLVVRLIGDGSSYEKVMAEASKTISNFQKDVPRALDDVAGKMKGFGQKVSMYLTLPLAGISAVARLEAGKFQTAMSQIVGLVGLSKETVNGFRKEIMTVAMETGKAPTELAEAMFFITSAGLRGANASEALAVSAKAAASGLGSTTSVADAVTSAMNAYGHSNLSATRATELLTAAVRAGKAEASQFAPQLGQILPLTASMKIGFEQVAAGLAFLTKTTGNASLAATGLKGILRVLIGGSKESIKNFAKMGLTIDQLQGLAQKQGLAKTLVLIRERADEAGIKLNELFTDSEGLTAALQFTGSAAADAQQVFDDVANSAGILDDAFAAVADTAGHKMNQAMAQMKILMIDIGDRIAPVFSHIRSFGMGIIDIWDKVPEPFKNVVVVIAAGASVIGPMIVMMGTLIASGSQMIKVYTWVTTTWKAWNTTTATTSTALIRVGSTATATAATVQTSAAASSAAMHAYATTTAVAASRITASYGMIALAAKTSSGVSAGGNLLGMANQAAQGPRLLGMTGGATNAASKYADDVIDVAFTSSKVVTKTSALSQNLTLLGGKFTLVTKAARLVLKPFQFLITWGSRFLGLFNPVTTTLAVIIGLFATLGSRGETLGAKLASLGDLLHNNLIVPLGHLAEMLTGSVGSAFNYSKEKMTEWWGAFIEATPALQEFIQYLKDLSVAAANIVFTYSGLEWLQSKLQDVHDFNEALAETAKINEKVAGANQTRFESDLSAVFELSGEARQESALRKMELDLEKNLAGIGSSIEGQKKYIEDEFGLLDAVINAQTITAEKAVLKELEDRKAQIEEQLKMVREAVPKVVAKETEEARAASTAHLKPGNDMIQALENKVTFFGMNPAETQSFQLQLQMQEALRQGNEEVAADFEKQMRIVDALNTNIEKMTKAAQLESQVKGLTESLDTQLATVNMTSAEIEIYKLQTAGATEEVLKGVKATQKQIEAATKHKQLLAEGKSLVEKYLSPQQKFAKTQEHLAELFNAGAIDTGTYNKALIDAKKEMDEIEDKSVNIDFNVQGVDAAIKGSSQALASIQEYMEGQIRKNPLEDPTHGLVADASGLLGLPGAGLTEDLVQNLPAVDLKPNNLTNQADNFLVPGQRSQAVPVLGQNLEEDQDVQTSLQRLVEISEQMLELQKKSAGNGFLLAGLEATS